MKISELIKQLVSIAITYGDLEVTHSGEDELPIKDIVVLGSSWQDNEVYIK